MRPGRTSRVLKHGWRYAALLVLAAGSALAAPGDDWPLYGGTDGNRYSPLTQITKANVGGLTKAWTYSMDAAGDPQTHPLAIGGVVYAYTPTLNVIALDGATGKLLWKFDSGTEGRGPQRGLTWWTDGKEKRLFASVMDRLYALDPATGKPIPSFGTKGSIDLLKGLGGMPGDVIDSEMPGMPPSPFSRSMLPFVPKLGIGLPVAGSSA
jgi:glucose dehydrogenase